MNDNHKLTILKAVFDEFLRNPPEWDADDVGGSIADLDEWKIKLGQLWQQILDAEKPPSVGDIPF